MSILSLTIRPEPCGQTMPPSRDALNKSIRPTLSDGFSRGRIDGKAFIQCIPRKAFRFRILFYQISGRLSFFSPLSQSAVMSGGSG